MRTKAVILLLGFLLAGCTKLGPDFKKPPQPPLPKSFHASHPFAKQTVAAWWTLFDDKALNRLIQLAASQNLDIRSAGLRILQARAALGIAEGYRYPQKQTVSGGYLTNYDKGHIDALNLTFDTLWEMDIWGKYAREVESARAVYMASVAGYRAATVAVLAETARQYIAFRTAQERLAYARRNAAIEKRVVKMTKIRFLAGSVSELDWQQAQTQWHNTLSAIPAMRTACVAARNALALLLAVTPEEITRIVGPVEPSTEKRPCADTPAFVPLPKLNPQTLLDARLLLQRPDVIAAEHMAHSAAAKIGAEKAKLYPSFTLLGSIGYQATDRNPVFRNWTGWGSLSNNIILSAGPGLSWNIFQYDRVKNSIRLQDALLQERLLAYTKTLIRAATEADTAWRSYRLALAQLQERQKALKATERAFALSALQYKEGLVSYQRLLSTVEKLTLTRDIYAQLKGSTAQTLIFLFKALGGGWQITRNRSFLHPADRKALRSRGVAWGRRLDANQTRLPEGVDR